MNENVPPGIPPIPQIRTSKLAIWSLVLGVLSLTCFGIFTILPGIICGHKAISAIDRSRSTLTGSGMAVAGLVMNYLGIFAIFFWMGLIAAIAIPNFAKARQTSQQNACIANLRQIDSAKQQWALEKNKKETDTPTAADLDPYIKGGFDSLHCPAGGEYSINPVGELPTCTVRGHQMPSGP